MKNMETICIGRATGYKLAFSVYFKNPQKLMTMNIINETMGEDMIIHV